MVYKKKKIKLAIPKKKKKIPTVKSFHQFDFINITSIKSS